jgi:hypothetical protein
MLPQWQTDRGVQMARISPGLTAALSVVLGAAIGLITNVVTGRWNWALAAGLVALVLVAATLAWWDRTHSATPPASSGRSKVDQTAAGGTIKSSEIQARRGADVSETARRQGLIEESSIDANGATVKRRAKKGTISDSHIEAD